MSYKIVGPGKYNLTSSSAFNAILNLAQEVSGNRHKRLSFLCLYTEWLSSLNFKGLAPVMSQEWQSGENRNSLGGLFWEVFKGFSHLPYSILCICREDLSYSRIFVSQQFNPLSVSKVDHIKTSALWNKEHKAREEKRPSSDKQ